MDDLLLKVHGLKKHFPVKSGPFSVSSIPLKAVDGVNMELRRGETMGLVGESGCGKTTVGRCLVRLYEPDAGRVFLNPDQVLLKEVAELDAEVTRLRAEYAAAASDSVGRIAKARRLTSLRRSIAAAKAKADERASVSDILSMPAHRLKETRRQIQMVFQDPWASLNPQMVVREIISEGPREYGTHQGPELERWVKELLDRVGLPAAAANRYPHEFSGGQRQRIGIARALALTPSLIVCDEPVSALDVSIQAQILNLLISLQDEFDLTYLFIAHDLSVVQYISDRASVMYLGKIVEQGRSDQLYQRPRHPYTISLLSSIPVADPDVRGEAQVLEGEVPSPVNPPPGCAFNPRCGYRTEICTRVAPKLENDEDGHVMACHNPPNG